VTALTGSEKAPAVAVSFVSVTYVTIAVQSYRAVEQMASPPPETTSHPPVQPAA